MEKTEVCIIGGGVIGLTCAYYLNKEGYGVTVIDKGPRESASSHGNCGLISSSHIIPLNNFNLIIKSVKWLFKKNAPFYIKPRFDPVLWEWLIKFVLNARQSKINEIIQAKYNLLSLSRQLYDKIIHEEELNCEWQETGYMHLCKSEKTFSDFQYENDVLIKYGYESSSFIGKTLTTYDPSIREDVYGGILHKGDAWFKPDVYIEELSRLLRSAGVVINQGEDVTEFNADGKIKTVKTIRERYNADYFVLATGALSPLMKHVTKLNIPIVPAKGYSITMDKPSIMPRHPIHMAERKVVATPFKHTLRLGSTLEFAGYNNSLSLNRLNALKTGAAEYLVEPYTNSIIEQWFGWRPMTPDGLPIIDQSPVHKNLYLACGHNMLGITMAPVTGKLIADMIIGKAPSIDLSPYSFSRF